MGLLGIDMKVAKLLPIITGMIMAPESITAKNRAKVADVVIGALDEMGEEETDAMITAFVAQVPAERREELLRLLRNVEAEILVLDERETIAAASA